ncbi:MAG: hypothetical protein KDF64_09780 [Geminicoccaceae bacterium]|nr:hypothetical protein [Geminicoccaceae bacterium]
MTIPARSPQSTRIREDNLVSNAWRKPTPAMAVNVSDEYNINLKLFVRAKRNTASACEPLQKATQCT